MARPSLAIVASSPVLAHTAWMSLRRLGPSPVVMLGPRRALERASRMHVTELPTPDHVDDDALRAAVADADAVFPCDERSHVRLLDAGIPVLGHPDGDSLRRLADKGALPDMAKEAGFRTPPLISDIWADGFGTSERYIEKPQYGGGGVGVREWHPEEPRRKGAILQPLIEGHDEDVSLAALDGRILGITAEQGLGPGMRCYEERPELEAVARALVKSTNYTGLLHIDLRVDLDGRPWVVDVNPRLWASHWMAAALGMDFAATFVRATRGEPLRWRRRTGVVAPPWRFREAKSWGRPRTRAALRAALARLSDLGVEGAMRKQAHAAPAVEVMPQQF